MSLELNEQYEKIYTFCYFKVKHRDIAEDITQETFLKYFETNSYLEKGKKLAFLYTIARNKCMDYFRKSKVTVSMEALEEICEESEDLETIITIRCAVYALTEEEQELVFLRFTNDLGISEISKYLGVSRFAVNRRLKAVEKQLKATLRKEDFYG